MLTYLEYICESSSPKPEVIVTRFGSQAHKLQELPELWLGKDVYLNGLTRKQNIPLKVA